MDSRLKTVAREAGKEVATQALSAFGKWVVKRPRVARMLERRPMIAKILAGIGLK